MWSQAKRGFLASSLGMDLPAEESLNHPLEGAAATAQTNLVGKELEDGRGWRSALLSRATARDTQFGFSLRHDRRVSDQSCVDCLCRWNGEAIAVNRHNRSRAVRTSLSRSTERRIVLGKLCSLGRAEYAMVHSIAAAACTYSRIALRA